MSHVKVTINELNPKELDVSSAYITILGDLSDLPKKSFEKVIQRMRMLHILDETEEAILRRQLRRINAK